ncbi:MAG: sugar porter family MFS transporter [Acidobacteriaceae bacterium]|nr:sugar porter family MFS transporter [Acidobacteriaceae bacterium]
MEAVQTMPTSQQKQGSRLYMLSICAVAALGALMFGFDIAIISGAGPFVQQYFALNEIAFGWGVSSLVMGSMVGALFAGRAADRYGRRTTLLAIALLFAVTSIACGMAHSFSAFVVARICGGLAVGAASMISPLYIAEISPASIRGRMVSLNQLAITFGILVSYGINYLLLGWGANNWRWMFATGALPSVAFFVGLFLVPESPRWLALRGRLDEARRILTRAGGDESAAIEMAAIKHADLSHEPQAKVAELWSPRFRYVIIVGALVAVLVQISGINTVITYAPIILRSAGNGLDAAIFQTFVIGIINFLFTFVSVLGVDRFGRRTLYMAGSAGMTVSLLLLSIGFATGHVMGIYGLALILLFIASFASCIGPVYWILMSEMFPARIRGVAMSFAVSLQWVTYFLVVLLFPWVLKHIGGPITFAFLAVMAFSMLMVAWKLVPETSGQTLEDIEQLYAKRQLEPGQS